MEAEAAGWRMAEAHRQAAVAQGAARRTAATAVTAPAPGKPQGVLHRVGSWCHVSCSSGLVGSMEPISAGMGLMGSDCCCSSQQ